MTRLPDTTADAVVGAVEAVLISRSSATDQSVADFLDLPVAKAREALDLAEDLGLIRSVSDASEVASPLCRLMSTPVLQQRAAVLRIAVESYEPFRVFRDRLYLNGNVVTTAAQQTKALLGISAHREVVKETLVSLGTYCRSLRATGGGEYEVHFEYEDDLRTQLTATVAQLAEADLRVRDWLSEDLRDYIHTRDVLDPLSEAYLKVSQGDSRGAIVHSGNAVESYLVKLATDMSVNVSAAHGLGAKVAALETAKSLPKKILAVGRYLSNVRNAADHGIDSEVNSSWTIRDGTGEDYLRVSITFMEITLARLRGKSPSL